ncbi:MAG: hypothetical protein M3Y13_07275 [Armatimonadota bacterium]|nr:hypothetical protein [Armatimonadota bacterium]
MSQEILTSDPDNSFVQTTSGESVSRHQQIVDLNDPVEKESVSHHPVAGASSEAPASSGIPSAMTQQAIRAGGDVASEQASIADHEIPTRQNVEP